MKVFVDNNLSPRMAEALQALFKDDHEIVHVRTKFGRGDLTDLEWIEALSKEGGWIVFSGDRRITKNKAERDAFKKARLTGFFIGKALLKKGPVQQVYRLLHQWDKIEKIASAVDDGATYEVTETKIKQI